MASVITTAVVTGGSNSHATTVAEVNAFRTDFATQGVVGAITNTNGISPATGAFAVNAQGSPAMFVDITSGAAYITATPSGQGSQLLRANMAATYTSYAISANATGSTRYDYIYLSTDATKANNPASDASDVTSLVTSRSTSNTADNGSPPTYGTLLTVVTVINGASSITNTAISDRRTQAVLTAVSSGAAAGSSIDWYALGAAPSSITALGNRSYTVVFNSVNYTTFLTNGQRLKFTRTAPAPTQCTSLNGTTQYYSKTSPAGMTFTDNYTCVGWVKLSAYQLGYIESRFDGTNGWGFRTDATGQLTIFGITGGSAARSAQTYQSVPLNKWVHVAMTATLSTQTFTAYMDGVSVTLAVTAGASASVQQAGNLNIGAANSVNFFNGKIAQAAVFNAVLSQATIQSYISQTLVGTEASLISAYSFNNSINDLNANANNLTAQGSAVATNADSPYSLGLGSLDYGIITANSFSTNTTLTVQVPEGCTIPTSGGVSAVAYSGIKVPYGFPADSGKWRIASLYMTDFTTTSNATYGAFSAGAFQLVAPVGAWDVGHHAGYNVNTTTSVYFALHSSALTGLSTSAAAALTPLIVRVLSAAASGYINSAKVSTPVSLVNAATYIMYTFGATTGGGIGASVEPAEVFAEFNLL